MAWLGDWAKRIKLTIDHERVDEDLVDFPVLVTLASGVGRGSTDVTTVFDELITVSGTKKIAITTDDGITKCYVEIERWDWSNEQAYLWTKIPTIVSGTDTDFYFYYDKEQLDNDLYVGDIGSAAGQAVWDNNFKGVWHLGEDPTGGSGCIKDSTSNSKNGTPGGSMTTADLVDGKIGKAIDFDGNNDYIDTTAVVGADGTATIEMSVNLTQQASSKGTFIFPTNHFYIHNANDRIYAYGTADYFKATITTGWQYISITYSGNTSTGRLCRNTTFVDQVQQTASHDIDAWNGYISNSSTAMYGIVDEVRQSNIVRSDSWIKTTYYSNWDNLMVFGDPHGFAFTCSGTVQVDSVLTDGIDVRLYRRSTGSFIGETTTISGGLFEIDTFYDEDHYIIALYTTSGTNALIYDYISP